MAGYNSEDSEVHIRYALGRRGTALSCLTGCDHSFFLFGLLTSYPAVIVQGYSPRNPKGKCWWRIRWDTQGKATAVIPDNAARGSLLTWTEVDDLIRTSRHTAIPFSLLGLSAFFILTDLTGHGFRYPNKEWLALATWTAIELC